MLLRFRLRFFPFYLLPFLAFWSPFELVATVRHPIVKKESSASILVCSGLELRFET